MRLLAAAILAVVCSAAGAAAVGADRVLYVGGTLKEFPARSGSPVRITIGAPMVEGTVDVTADDRLVFTAGRSGTFRDPSNHDQTVVFELGRNLVRPTLETLERRTGKTVAFQNTDACVRFKTRDTCGIGGTAELADIILKFESARSPNPQCPCEGGRGELFLVQGARHRVVLMCADRKMGVWGRKPAVDFSAEVVAALKDANGIK